MTTAVAADAKEIRQALKKRYPLTKFSVRSRFHSGGGSIDISWFDGPTRQEVKAISEKYQQVGHDGGGNQLVFCSRRTTQSQFTERR